MERIEKLQELMKSENVKQVIVYDHDSIYYLVGVKTSPTICLQALVVNQEGLPKLFFYSIQRYEFRYPNITSVELCPYDRYTSPEKCLLSYAASEVNVDPNFPSEMTKHLESHGKKVNIDNLVYRMRRCKDEEELACIREASRLSDEVMKYAKSLLVPGVSENEVAKKVVQYIQALPDCKLSFKPFIMFDESCSYNRMGSNRILTDKSYVMMDLGVMYKQYHADTTRMFFHRCNKEQIDLYLKCCSIVEEIEKNLKPGITYGDVDKITMRMLKEYGLDNNIFFHTGHGVGLAIHEYDYVASYSDVKLKKGNVFSIEPGCYFVGEKGARCEDLIAISDTGCEVFNKLDKYDMYLD